VPKWAATSTGTVRRDLIVGGPPWEGDEEHDDMVMWLGLEHAAEFDPAAFDVELVNRRLIAVGSSR
jgi:hypothetical protein